MAKKPVVRLRKPPAAVDLDALEAFVQGAPTDPPKRAAPRGSGKPSKTHKSVLARRDGRRLQRLTLYLPEDLARRLKVHCATHGLELSTTIAQAVERWVARTPRRGP
jgi:hypothetical protein